MYIRMLLKTTNQLHSQNSPIQLPSVLLRKLRCIQFMNNQLNRWVWLSGGVKRTVV